MINSYQSKDLVNTIIDLQNNNISLLIKVDEIDKEKTKIRLFYPPAAVYVDGYIGLWEINEDFILLLIAKLKIKVLEQIEIKNKLNEQRKKRVTQ